MTAFPSNDADLAGLTLFSATMSFDSATANYELSVANLVSSLTVTPTTADSAATATLSVYDNTNTKVINAVSVSSGQASGPVLLSVGSNKIDVEVTAQNGS